MASELSFSFVLPCAAYQTDQISHIHPTYSGRQNWRKSPFLNNFFEIMKKRHNSAPWAPDEASPYLNESSRCAESESEEHFVRKAHFSAHFSVKNCYFPIKKKLQNYVEIMFQRNIRGQLDVRTRMRASKSWNFDLEKPIKPIKMDSCVICSLYTSNNFVLYSEISRA